MGGTASVVETQPAVAQQPLSKKAESKKHSQRPAVTQSNTSAKNTTQPQSSTITIPSTTVANSEPKSPDRSTNAQISNTNNGQGAAEPPLSNTKLKKLALGIQSYKDTQRDYDATLSQLELNRTAQMEWSEPKLKPKDSFYTEKSTTPNRAKHFDFSQTQSSKSSADGSTEELKKKASVPTMPSMSEVNRSGDHGASFAKLPPRVVPSPKQVTVGPPPSSRQFPRKDQHIDVDDGGILMADFSNGESPSRSFSRPQNVPDLRNQLGNLSVQQQQLQQQQFQPPMQTLQGGPFKKPMTANTPNHLHPTPMLGPPPSTTHVVGPPPNMMIPSQPNLTMLPPTMNAMASYGGPPPNMAVPPPNIAALQGLPPNSNKVIFVPMNAPPTMAMTPPINLAMPTVSMTPPPNTLLPLATPGLSSSAASSSNRPPPSNAPIPTVIETTDVKRNRAQLPKTTEHAKPTTGDWLEKRYIVNDYILLYTLGTGSYGEVRLCKNRKTDKLYAIKIISKDFLKKKKSGKSDETYFEDIKREIAIMKKLSHPNILRLFEVLDDPKVNKMYLVLEYMKMGDLINILKKQGISEDGTSTNAADPSKGFTPMMDQDLYHIFKQLIAGIEYLHKQNIVHGDIKPQNLLLGEDGTLKIADFGISQMLSGEGEKLADAGGTPAFMAPELCEQRSSFSGQKADIWAIGATIFMLKFGHPPFVAKSIINLYHKICNDPLVFPGPINPTFKHLLEGILEKDPNRRMTIAHIRVHPWFDLCAKLPAHGATINFVPPPSTLQPPNSSTPLPSSSHRPTVTNSGRIIPFPNIDPEANANGKGAPSSGVGSQQATAMMTLSFQPPATYEAEQEAAMKAPTQTINNTDIFMSISGIKPPSDSDLLKQQKKKSPLNKKAKSMRSSEKESRRSSGGSDEDDDDDDDDLEDDEDVVDFLMTTKPTNTSNSNSPQKKVSKKNLIKSQQQQSTPGKEDNVMQTNWGADVFQIVDADDMDEDDIEDDEEDEVDDVDLDSDDDDDDDDDEEDEDDAKERRDKVSDIQTTARSNFTSRSKSKKSLGAKQSSGQRMMNKSTSASSLSSQDSGGSNSSRSLTSAGTSAGVDGERYGMMRKESHSQMSSEEEERRSKQFKKKIVTKKLSCENILLSDPNNTGNVAGRSSSSSLGGGDLPTTRHPKVTNLTTEISGLTAASYPSPSGRSVGGYPTHSAKSKLDSPGFNSSFLSQTDYGEDGEVMEALDNETLAEIMDTLAQQPSKHTNVMHASIQSTTLLEEETHSIAQLADDATHCPVSFDHVTGITFHNPKNAVGGVLASEQGRRPSQEDRVVFIPNVGKLASLQVKEIYQDHYQMFAMACVFDGHNGMKASQYLSQHFINTLIHHELFLDPKQLPLAIEETCLYLDTQLCHLLRGEEEGGEDISGSTGVVAIYDGRKHVLTVAGVGDSLCVVSRNGRAIVMNSMHRLDNVREQERVKAVGGLVINHRVNGILAVSRAFGDIPFKSFQPHVSSSSHHMSGPHPMPSSSTPFPALPAHNTSDKLADKLVLSKCLITAEPEIRSERITPKTEFAILATDGLWDVMSPQVAVNFVRKKLTNVTSTGSSSSQKADLHKIAQELIHEAIERGSVDNVSCVLLAFHVTPSVPSTQ